MRQLVFRQHEIRFIVIFSVLTLVACTTSNEQDNQARGLVDWAAAYCQNSTPMGIVFDEVLEEIPFGDQDPRSLPIEQRKQRAIDLHRSLSIELDSIANALHELTPPTSAGAPRVNDATVSSYRTQAAYFRSTPGRIETFTDISQFDTLNQEVFLQMSIHESEFFRHLEDIEDSDGELLERTFEIVPECNSRVGNTTETDFDSRVPTATPDIMLELVSSEMVEVDEFGMMAITGRVLNSGDNAVRFVQITFALLNDDGDVVDTVTDNIAELGPNATWAFTASFLDFAGVTSTHELIRLSGS